MKDLEKLLEIDFTKYEERKKYFAKITENGEKTERILYATRTIFKKLFYDEFFMDPFLKNLCRPIVHIPDGNEFTTFNVYSEGKIKKAHVKPKYIPENIIIGGISIDSWGGDYYYLLDSEIFIAIRKIIYSFYKYIIKNFESMIDTNSKYAGIGDEVTSFKPLVKVIKKPLKINNLEDFISDIKNNGGSPTFWIFHWRQLIKSKIFTEKIFNMPIFKFVSDNITYNIIMAIDLHENEYIFEEWCPFNVEICPKIDDNMKFKANIRLLFSLINPCKSGILILEE